jgi:Na+-transporting methylmalonyl-CoA/oxaloacetate decarboxylase gamma subunit
MVNMGLVFVGFTLLILALLLLATVYYVPRALSEEEPEAEPAEAEDDRDRTREARGRQGQRRSGRQLS